MNITEERQGDTLIVAADGRVDGSNSQEFQQALEGVIGDSDRAVVLQLKGLSYISSSGLRVMLMVARMLQKRGTQFALCELTESIREVFEISGFDRIIPVHDSQSAAVAAVTAG